MQQRGEGGPADSWPSAELWGLSWLIHGNQTNDINTRNKKTSPIFLVFLYLTAIIWKDGMPLRLGTAEYGQLCLCISQSVARKLLPLADRVLVKRVVPELKVCIELLTSFTAPQQPI